MSKKKKKKKARIKYGQQEKTVVVETTKTAWGKSAVDSRGDDWGHST